MFTHMILCDKLLKQVKQCLLKCVLSWPWALLCLTAGNPVDIIMCLVSIKDAIMFLIIYAEAIMFLIIYAEAILFLIIYAEAILFWDGFTTIK